MERCDESPADCATAESSRPGSGRPRRIEGGQASASRFGILLSRGGFIVLFLGESRCAWRDRRQLPSRFRRSSALRQA